MAVAVVLWSIQTENSEFVIATGFGQVPIYAWNLNSKILFSLILYIQCIYTMNISPTFVFVFLFTPSVKDGPVVKLA